MAWTDPKRRSSSGADPKPGKGRRRTPRRRRALNVECLGADGVPIPVRTVDASRGGILLEFAGGRWRVPADERKLVAFAEQLRQELPDGFEVSFGLGIVRARASIVRVIPSSPPDAPFRVALRFDPELTAEDARRLGLGLVGDEEPPPPPARPAPLVMGADVEMEVRLLATKPARGTTPAAMSGRLADAQAHALTVEIGAGLDAAQVAGALGADVRLSCVARMRVIWDCVAHVRRVETTASGRVRVLLLAEQLPPAAVLTAMASGEAKRG